MAQRLPLAVLALLFLLSVVACTPSEQTIQAAVQVALAATQAALPTATLPPTVTPSASATATLTPVPTATPTPRPTRTPGPTATPSPTPVPIPTFGPEHRNAGARCIDPITNDSYIYLALAWSLATAEPVHITGLVDEQDGDLALLMTFTYVGDDWLFVDELIMNLDGEVVRFTPDYTDTEVLNSGRVWEWGYVVLGQDDRAFVDKLVGENVLVRLSGPEGQYDYAMTTFEAATVRYAYMAYMELRSGASELSDFPESCPE